MANLFDCLNSAIAAKHAHPGRARAAQTEFRQIVAQLETHYPTHIAQAMAAARIKEAAARGASARRHTVMAQLGTMQRNRALLDASADPSFSLIELIEGKQGTGNTHESVRFVREGIRRQLLGMIHEALAKHGTDILGRVRDKVGMAELVRELHGEASGNAGAKRMADAVRAAQTRARTLFNAHGGDIRELADFGLPHSHDLARIRRAGFDAWRAEVAPRLDWTRIEDAATGKPFGSATAPGVERMLRDVFDGITTRNWDERSPSMAITGGTMLANRRAEHRVLHFRDATAWQEYNTQFGTGNAFQAMVGHLEGMARDIALLRVLGPNPKAGLEHAIQIAEQKASLARDPRAERAVQARSYRARAMLGAVTGAVNAPADEAWSTFFATTRSLLTAAQLGGAVLSAATDLWTVRMAAKSVGMNNTGALVRRMQLIGSSATRETARQMGYVADTLANAGSIQARFLGEVWAPEIVDRITNAVLRASGLSYWTDMGRVAFQMEFSGFLASQAHLRFDAIDPALRRVLAGRGITAAEWAELADPASMFTAPNGAKFIAPLHWINATRMPRAEAEGLAARLSAIMEEQGELAIPTVSLEGRAILLGDTKPGTFGGELLRSGLMYKSFALSVTLGQIRRTMDQPSGMSRATYAASLIAGLTLFGAVSVQLKLIASGRDPRDMREPTFWGAAFLQGGGVGIFGDFLTAETSRVGGGLAETIAGPVVGLGADVLRAGASNAKRAIDGKDTLLGRDVVNLLRRYTPGTSLWQIRTALDRLVWDQMQALLDPEAEAAWRQQEGARKKNTGTETFWQRGELAPERGPDLARAIGAT